MRQTTPSLCFSVLCSTKFSSPATHCWPEHVVPCTIPSLSTHQCTLTCPSLPPVYQYLIELAALKHWMSNHWNSLTSASASGEDTSFGQEDACRAWRTWYTDLTRGTARAGTASPINIAKHQALPFISDMLRKEGQQHVQVQGSIPDLLSRSQAMDVVRRTSRSSSSPAEPSGRSLQPTSPHHQTHSSSDALIMHALIIPPTLPHGLPPSNNLEEDGPRQLGPSMPALSSEESSARDKLRDMFSQDPLDPDLSKSLLDHLLTTNGSLSSTYRSGSRCGCAML